MDDIQRQVLNWYMQDKTPDNLKFKEDVARHYLSMGTPGPAPAEPSGGPMSRYQFNRELKSIPDFRSERLMRQARLGGDFTPLPGEIPDPTAPYPEEPPQRRIAPSLLSSRRRRKAAKPRKPADRLLWDLLPTTLDPAEEAWIRDQVGTALKEQGLIGARRVLAQQLDALGGEIPEGLGETTEPLPAYQSRRAAERQRKAKGRERKDDLRQIALRERAVKDLNRQQLAEKRFRASQKAVKAREERRKQTRAEREQARREKQDYRRLKSERDIIKAANKGLASEIWGTRIKRILPDPADQMRTAKLFVRVAREKGLPFALDMLTQEEARRLKR